MEEDATAVRARLDDLLAKAKSDDTFAYSLEHETEATLQAAGFEGEALETITRELGGSEVEGFRACSWTCDRYSCWVTACGNIPMSN
jgi:hypothetical protein